MRYIYNIIKTETVNLFKKEAGRQPTKNRNFSIAHFSEKGNQFPKFSLPQGRNQPWMATEAVKELHVLAQGNPLFLMKRK